MSGIKHCSSCVMHHFKLTNNCCLKAGHFVSPRKRFDRIESSIIESRPESSYIKLNKKCSESARNFNQLQMCVNVGSRCYRTDSGRSPASLHVHTFHHTNHSRITGNATTTCHLVNLWSINCVYNDNNHHFDTHY